MANEDFLRPFGAGCESTKRVFHGFRSTACGGLASPAATTLRAPLGLNQLAAQRFFDFFDFVFVFVFVFDLAVLRAVDFLDEVRLVAFDFPREGFAPLSSMTTCAAARRAMGTR